MTAKSRFDLNETCSTCRTKFRDHDEDNLIECINTFHPDYDGTLPSLLVALSTFHLIVKWGQPGANKKEWAAWPEKNKPPILSTVPIRDFAVYFLIQQKPKEVKKEKESKGDKETTKHPQSES